MKKISIFVFIVVLLLNIGTVFGDSSKDVQGFVETWNWGISIVVDDWNYYGITDTRQTFSKSNQCPIRPPLYSNTRYKDKGEEFGHDLTDLGLRKDEISRNAILRQLDIGKYEYGLYYRFTPSGVDDGYKIGRIDFVISDSRSSIFTIGITMNRNITCQKNTAYFFNFIPLTNLFKKMIQEKGDIKKGKYTIDVFFNQKWSGECFFRIVD